MRETAQEYRPPYDLTTDMLIVATLLPTRPLRRAFPRVPFFSLFGRTLAIVWFRQVTDGWYTGPEGWRRRLGDGHTPLYTELNVMTALWRWAVFAPGILATSELSIQIGHCYGMPKRPTRMRFVARNAGGRVRVWAEAMDGDRVSVARARALGSGRLLAAAARLMPRWSWPVRFPSGSAVRALLLRVSAVHIASIGDGRLALSADWLPRPARLLPIGLFLSGLRMLLPSNYASAPDDR